MKKYIYIYLLLSLLFLSGCQKASVYDSETLDMLHTALVDTFMHSDVFSSLIQEYDAIKTGIIRETFGIYSTIQDDLIHSNIVAAMTFDTDMHGTQSLMTFSGEVEDYISNDIFQGSGVIYHIYTGDQQYISRHTGYISLGEGNAETFIIQLILGTIQGQWMWIDDTGFVNLNLSSLRSRKKGQTLLHTLQRIVRDTSRFTRGETQEGRYSMDAIDTSMIASYVSDVYHQQGTETEPPLIIMDAYMDTNNGISLIIQNLEDANKNRLLTGTLGVKKANIFLTQDEHYYQVKWQEKKQGVSIVLQYTKDNKVYIIDLVLIPVKSNDTLSAISYSGTVTVPVGGGVQTHTIQFPIAGLYTIHIVNDVLFHQPKKYLIMSQIFGDEYGIINLLNNEEY